MIQIKNPCDANWQEMTPADSGKYCGACEKVVVDFSKMNDVQIKQYFTDYATQKTCGRFLSSQVNRPLVKPHKFHNSSFWKKIRRAPVLNSFTFLFVSSILWLSSCVKKHVVTGEVESTTCEPIIMGDTIATPIKQDTTNQVEMDTLNIIQGEVAEPIHVKMGKVKMVDTISQNIKRKK